MGVALAHSCNSFLRVCEEWKLLQLDILRLYGSQKQAKSTKRDWCTNRQKRPENKFQIWAKMSLWVLTLKLGYLRLECGKVLVNIVLRAAVLNRSVIHKIQIIFYCDRDCNTHLASLNICFSDKVSNFNQHSIIHPLTADNIVFKGLPWCCSRHYLPDLIIVNHHRILWVWRPGTEVRWHRQWLQSQRRAFLQRRCPSLKQ